jgi:hypothetical protein
MIIMGGEQKKPFAVKKSHIFLGIFPHLHQLIVVFNILSMMRHNCPFLQGVDMPFSKMATTVLEHPDYTIHRTLKITWTRLLATFVNDGVSGIMQMMDKLEKLAVETSLVPPVHRSSLCGIFIRRILLGFEKLSFSDVSNLSKTFRQFYLEGTATVIFIL